MAISDDTELIRGTFDRPTQRPPVRSAQSSDRNLTSPLNALRIVMTVALERTVAAECLGEDPEVCLSLWPSSLYGLLATEAMRSRPIWERCSWHIDRALGDVGRKLEALPPASLAELFREGSQILNIRELAALLWALLKRREPMSENMAGRLGAEVEVVAVRRSRGYS